MHTLTPRAWQTATLCGRCRVDDGAAIGYWKLVQREDFVLCCLARGLVRLEMACNRCGVQTIEL
jgi:hypothetical protein